MGLYDTINLLKNGYFSTDTSITGDCSLRNDGKSILVGGLVVQGNLTATAAQTIDFSGNVPRCTGTPTNGSDLVNKTYVDSSFHPIGSYVDLTTNQTVGGVKTFTSNLVAQASTGDVFQAFKNSVVGNAGRVIINSSGDLLYFDAVESLLKWKLDPDGLLTTTGGITASATQTINFGSNNPTMGASNINYGSAALRVGTSGSYSQKSIAIGTTSFGTAIESVAIGDQALNASGSTANYSVAIGVNSLALATGERNTAIGTESLPVLTGTENGANTAIGNLTGTKLTSGTTNLFLGLGSGAGITSGSNNLIVGSSMFASISPDDGDGIDNNICVGTNAMGYIKNNTQNNCAIGAYALYSELGYAGASTVAIGPNAGVRSLGSNCTFIGNGAGVDVANSTYNYSMALGDGATVSASNQIVLGTASQTTNCWAINIKGLPTLSAGLTVSAGAIDLSGNVPRCTGVPVNGSDLVNKTYVDSSFHPIGSYVDLSSNQTVGGVKTFTSNLRAQATSGDVFQAFKNSVVGNAGHILVNDLGNLSYFDSTAAVSRWRLDTSGNLTVGSIDLSGTLINKTTTAGTYIRSNSNATGYFFANNNGDIGYTDSTAGIGNRWFINATGVARFISSSNSFKYWEIAGNVFRYYNLGGTYTIVMNGDSGNINTPGAISSASLYTTGNILVDGTIVSNDDLQCVNIVASGSINSGNIISSGDIDVINVNSTGEVNTVNVVVSADIFANSGGVFAVNIDASNNLIAGNQLDLQGNLSNIVFTGTTASIRVGQNSTVTTDATNDNVNIGNDSTALGGLNFVGGKSATGQVRSVAVGNSSVAGTNAVAVGSGASANNAQSIAVGHLAIVNGQQSIGVGEGVLASSLQGVALGAEAESTNTQVISIGYQAKGNQVNAIAIGALSVANGQEGIALGFEATANFSNSVSIGKGVACTAANDFRLGNASHKVLLKQIYFPFEISPTSISATGGLPASPYYGIYRISAGSSITITLPAITAAMEGMIITFRKTGPLTIVVSITCSAGNTYLPLNSTTSTAAGTNTTLLNTSSVTGRVMVISGSQWAVCT